MNLTDEQIHALEAGREMDALIAEHIFSKPFRKPTHGTCCTCQNCGEDYETCGGDCHYSTDISAAWQVVDKMHAEGWAVQVDNDMDYHNQEKGAWNCFIAGDGVFAVTAPLAICKAALKAKAIKRVEEIN